MSAWQVLGIEKTTNKKLIKRAYAKLLKLHKPEQDPAGYQSLREAYDDAISYCKNDNKNFVEGFHSETVTLDIPIKPLHHTELQEKNNLEFQYSEQSIKEIEHETGDSPDAGVFNELNHVVHELFSIEDSLESLKAFKALLKSDLLLNIKNRKLFSLLSIEKGIDWDGDFEYPGVLLNDMATELAWFDIDVEHESAGVAGNHYFQLRINACLEYLALVKLSKKRVFLSRESLDIRAARLILGEYRSGYFNFQAFIDSSRSFNAIKKIIDRFTQHYSLELCPQINTPSFRWWQKRLERHAYSVIDVIIAAGIVVNLIVLNDMSVIKIYSLSIEQSITSSISVFAVVVLSIVVNWMINLGLKGFRFTKQRIQKHYRVISHYIVESWESIKYRPLIYYGVTSLYLSMFLLAGYLNNSSYEVGLLLSASILLFIMLEAKIILLCIAYLPYGLVKSGIDITGLPIVLNYIFVFVALLSIFSFEKLQQTQFSGWATRGTLGVVFSMSVISGLISFVLFKSLNYIILF